LEHVKLNDHHALGVIDAFVKQLKHVLSKEFLDIKSTKWIDILPTIVEQCNDTPHSSLDDITPNEAIYDEKKRVHVLHLNIQKGEQIGFTTDLKAGDKVRIYDTAMFKKGVRTDGVTQYTQWPLPWARL
jgi:hypothetical protein